MSRRLLSGDAAAMAALVLAHGTVTLAESVRPELAQKQLVSRTNCETAAHVTASADFLSKSAEYRDDVRITTRYCSATAHNQLNPANPQIVVVGANPNATGGDRVFFRTIPKNDGHKLHDACLLAAKGALAYTQSATTPMPQPAAVIAGVDVRTTSGKVDCEGFLRATDAANPLVVLAPSVISGSVISVHILDMIGLKRDSGAVQAAVDSLRHQLAGSGATNQDDIRKQPQIILDSSGSD